MNKLIFKILFTMVLFASSMPFNSQSISSEFPYESRFIEINGHKMHYVESGTGDPILFLHGVPMSSYSWRNIIPHLSESSRCIAIDFIGFGKSDKPEISYTYDNQYEYLESFINELGLKNITLVMTDIGGIIGQKYARLHPEKIKAMCFMETPVTDAVTFHKNGGVMQKMMFSMARRNKLGHRMFVKKNMFIKMMPKLIKRKLSKEEKMIYAAPFVTEKSRMPMFVLPNAWSKKGKNAKSGDMADYLNKNSGWLITSKHPKLIITAKPGMLMNKKNVKWIDENLIEYKIEHVGKAKHLMEEDLPHEIGVALQNWYLSL